MHHMALLVVWLYMVDGVSSLEFVHHGNEALTDFLRDINTTYPDITHLYSIGKSVRGQELWVISIGKNPRDYVELRPNVKYVGNMHGNEAVSREVLIHLVNHYVKSHDVNSTITEYLDTTLVHIMPAMNPDGYDESTPGKCSFKSSGRKNYNYVDLNRNFPNIWTKSTHHTRAPETNAVTVWMSQHTFVISSGFHSNQNMVAKYPYDAYKPGATANRGPSVTPDDDVFRFLALTYSRSYRTMAATNRTLCENDDVFQDGITNGADWFLVIGGMQDYNYLKEGIMEISLGIACCIFPNESALEDHWNENRDALLNYNFEVHRGIKGIIKNENNQSIEGAELTIKGRESVNFHSSKHGEYFRVLMPVTYTLQVLADKYLFTSTNVTVIDGGPTRQDITLKLAPTTSTAPTTSVTPIHSVTPANSARPTNRVMSMKVFVCMCGWISAYL